MPYNCDEPLKGPEMLPLYPATLTGEPNPYIKLFPILTDENNRDLAIVKHFNLNLQVQKKKFMELAVGYRVSFIKWFSSLNQINRSNWIRMSITGIDEHCCKDYNNLSSIQLIAPELSSEYLCSKEKPLHLLAIMNSYFEGKNNKNQPLELADYIFIQVLDSGGMWKIFAKNYNALVGPLCREPLYVWYNFKFFRRPPGGPPRRRLYMAAETAVNIPITDNLDSANTKILKDAMKEYKVVDVDLMLIRNLRQCMIYSLLISVLSAFVNEKVNE